MKDFKSTGIGKTFTENGFRYMVCRADMNMSNPCHSCAWYSKKFNCNRLKECSSGYREDKANVYAKLLWKEEGDEV